MIFYFDIKPEDWRDLPNVSRGHALSKALEASRRGKHLVVIPRKLAAEMLTGDSIAPHDQSQLRALMQSFSQYGGLVEDFLYWRVVAQEGAYSRADRIVGFDQLIDTNILNTPEIMVENGHYDGIVIDLLVRALRASSEIPDLAFKFCHCGGKDDIERQFDARSKRFCIIITDSDRSDPNCRIQDIFYKLNDLVARGEREAIVLATYGREIENLLSPSFYMSTIGNNFREQSPDLYDALSREFFEDAEDAWLFVDLKNGISNHEGANPFWADFCARNRLQAPMQGFYKNIIRRVEANSENRASLVELVSAIGISARLGLWLRYPIEMLIAPKARRI